MRRVRPERIAAGLFTRSSSMRRLSGMKENQSNKLPVVPLYKKVVFPFCNLSFASSLRILGGVKAGDRIIALPIRSRWDVFFRGGKIAVLSEVVEVKHEDGSSDLQIKGIERVRLRKSRSVFYAEYERAEAAGEGDQERLREDLRKKSQELIFLINMGESDKLIHLLNFIVELRQLTDFISNYFVLKFPRRYEMLNEPDPSVRAKALLGILDELIGELKDKK